MNDEPKAEKNRVHKGCFTCDCGGYGSNGKPHWHGKRSCPLPHPRPTRPASTDGGES